MWWRRRRTPVWVWVLALLGLKSVWTWRNRATTPHFEEKRRRFGEKLDEAFQVWREPVDPVDGQETDADPDGE